MIAYYEAESAHPPTSLLPAIARALRTSTDALLGVTSPPRARNGRDSRIERRLREIERLGAREKRQALQILDALIERERLKRKVGAG